MRLMAALAVAGVCILAAGCSGGTDDASKTSTTTSTTTTKPPPPVQEAALNDLLLPPEQINAAMGATDMVVTKTQDAMSDDSATMEPKECLAVDGALQAVVYGGSDFSTVRGQTLTDGDNFAHYALQAVVLFPGAKLANAFFTASTQQWPACHQYTHLQTGTHWTVGPVNNASGMLSSSATQQDAKAPGWGCGRALAIRNNVVIDINTCSANPGDSAVNMANQIAAKVPIR
ncbi:hypothetical protein A5651_11810 [Mycobacterium sp. 1274761.0]|nr:sensor domain-containing protein [Mycobacterium sp. 1274761.0]OBK73986.1 hypothetical protein A5651_11810 [Mycobacterium sp. 1274761.0]